MAFLQLFGEFIPIFLTFRSWLNRRQIDGSLNRTPLGFYDRVWQILERTCNGITVEGNHLPQVAYFEFFIGKVGVLYNIKGLVDSKMKIL